MKAQITQIRSVIGRPKDQRDTIIALGLGKINRTVVKEVNSAMLGMMKKVTHLIKVEEV